MLCPQSYTRPPTVLTNNTENKEEGRNMRSKAVDKDGGRAKCVPVQMEPLWGFWTEE